MIWYYRDENHNSPWLPPILLSCIGALIVLLPIFIILLDKIMGVGEVCGILPMICLIWTILSVVIFAVFYPKSKLKIVFVILSCFVLLPLYGCIGFATTWYVLGYTL